eukprot:TRINITY_DN11633_c0_g2_i1.p1 TRINITY_DN11633_c0_g2~~TRINITY_DN11633_c0_g2_i1.p1  ORF type:complete len:256 (+),score=49.86 TRINITY_DN11633_c0_g2_i1:170-937(+)
MMQWFGWISLLTFGALCAGRTEHAYTQRANKAGWKADQFEFVDPTELDNRYNVRVIHRDPLILEFPHFVSNEEIDALIVLGERVMGPSTGGLNREVGTYRTSSTGWLIPNAMVNETASKVVYELEDRIADATGIPADNQEHFQVLRYEPGQYYHTHNDFIDEQVDLPCGPRVATFFLYLNDVPEGGATHFPKLNLKVKPRKGHAILWYSVRERDLHMDSLSDHEAQPVVKGIKWAANKWIHIDDFVNNWARGMTG